MTEHGTYAGYVAHRRRKEEACEECKQARRSYTSERRAQQRGTATQEREKAASAARHAALERLRRLHPTMFRNLLNEERDRRDLPLV